MKNLFTKVPKGYKISFFSFLGLVAIALVTWKPIALNYGKWLAAGENNPTGDMSVLLSGSEKRLNTLIQLYTRGNVQAIYYAAGIDEKPAQLKIYRDIFEKYNLPKDDLYCGELVESTYHEAQAFQRKLKEFKQPVDEIVLVSDRYHLRRGIWSFRQVFGNDLKITAYSTPSSSEMLDPEWWKHQTSRKEVIAETKRMAFYLVYYGLLGQEDLLTHGHYNQLTTGKSSKGVENACQIVLPQLTNN